MPDDYELYIKEDFRDAHPTQKMHYEFMRDKFPQFDTEESKNTFELLESIKFLFTISVSVILKT